MNKPIDTSTHSFGLASWRGRPATMSVPHRHNDVELNYLERGAVSYVFGGEHIPLRSGDTCLFWAARPHRLLIDHEHEAVMLWLTLPLSLFLHWRLPATVTAQVLRGVPLFQSHAQSWPHDPDLMHRWRDDLIAGDDERHLIVQLELEAYLRRFALHAQNGEHHMTPASRQTNSAATMARLIVEHYAEPLTVADIASSVGLHPHYAMHIFREAYGESVISYLTQHRVAHAQQLLATTDASVLAIGIDAGFASVSRFYSAFKQVCGVSPGAYRTALRSSVRVRRS